MNNTILVTGGAGFIGSNFVLQWIAKTDERVVNLDLLTYAGNRRNLQSIADHPRHIFVHGDIADEALVGSLLQRHQPRAIAHFAAESHVDRSIAGPAAFLQTNILGTFALLQQARTYWDSLSGRNKNEFRFLHVSTDEVYGTLRPEEPAFSETTPYAPNSPYAASKASSDMLVRAWHHTYGLPALTTNCSNNYGPYQFPEKLIPLMILNALEGKPLPVYGDGRNVRDWLFVEDHCAALRCVLENGRIGDTYNIGGNSERPNIEVVNAICDIVDEIKPDPAIGSRRKLITYVKDRPGHDRRYAIDITKISRELNWRPSQQFESGIRRTIEWFIEHLDWVNEIRSGEYQQWIDFNYAERLAR
ncbi:MAG TPA: dTDP-glucose 4,6-dehydratase [Silvibacterium sp.]|nr:dTDP-glucose 4,6-dehydratase [Silvibacterium sp.]